LNGQSAYSSAGVSLRNDVKGVSEHFLQSNK
jgi:hypothetical protein